MRHSRRPGGLRLVAIDEIAGGGDAVVARVAAIQRGVVSVPQLRAAGLDASDVARRVRGSRLHRVHQGVYLVGHAEPAPLAAETAALLACGAGALLSHATAGHLLGLLPAPAGVHVTVVGRKPRSRDGVRAHHTPSLSPEDCCLRDGLPITTAARTLVDLSAHLPDDVLERALAEAMATRQVSRSGVEAALARATDRRGGARLRAGLDDGADYLRSDGERALRGLLRAAGLPRPRFNFDIGRWSADAAWPERRLVLELDGRDGHSSPWARDRDARKTLELEAAGWRVVRITGRQLHRRPEWVVAEVAAALSRSAGTR